jgi:AmiR/NasT family two-component response regulator
MTARIPNFRDQRALLLLERLGASVTVRWPAEAVSAQNVDVLFFDSDLGFSGLFSWEPGRAAIPLIAVFGSEAPGRIEWTLAQAPAAYLFKPIGSTGVFTALSIAYHNFALRRDQEQALRQLGDRLQMRGTVLRAAVTLMQRHDLDDEHALRLLRSESMRRRLTLEAMSALVLDGKWLPVDGSTGKAEPETGRRRIQSS